MRPARWSGKLLRPAQRRFQKLRGVVSGIGHRGLRPENERELAYAIVEVWNTWREFARAYMLSSTVGLRLLDGSVGIPQAVPVPDHEAGRRECIRSINRPTTRFRQRDEPDWTRPFIILKLAQALDLSNTSAIMAALSLNTRVFDDLPCVRNFYAHRNRRTFEAAVELANHYSITSPDTPSAFVLSTSPGRPQSVLEDWMDDLSLAVTFLCDPL